MTIRPPLDVQVASQLAAKVQLRDVICVESSAKYASAPVASQHVTLSWDLKDPHAYWRLDDGEISVLFPFEFTIEGKDESESQSKQVADLRLVFQTSYALEKPAAMPVSELPHYLGVSGFMHLWPYVRAEVQCMTSKLRLPPLVLPVVVSGHAARIVTISGWGTVDKPRPKALPSTRKAKAKKKRRTA